MAFAILRACRWAEARIDATPRHLDVALGQVQGMIVDGFDDLPHATLLLVAFDALGGLGAFLGAQPATSAMASGSPSDDTPHSALNIALSAHCVARLGLPEQTWLAFDPAFREGVATADRAIRLGDTGVSDPSGWAWGGPANATFDAALLLFARTHDAHAERVTSLLGLLSAHGGEVVHRLDTALLPGRREHFGFRGGIAQPALDADIPAPLRKGVLAPDTRDNTIAPGEVFLGYSNEFGELSRSPSLPVTLATGSTLPPARTADGSVDLGRDGSYLVVRQLAQDVHGFWRALRDATASAAERDLLAAKLVGRWPSGAPLVRSPERDRPELASVDDFGFALEDPDGLRCPFGAHIRRANPRDWKLSTDRERAMTMGRQHRIVRRSRPYGPAVAASFDPEDILATPTDGVERGLLFMCFGGDIARQFEVIQEAWMHNPSFAKLRGEVDPLLGNGDASKHFSVPQRPFAKRYFGIPAAVTVRGAAYLFMPSIAALAYCGERARVLGSCNAGGA